MVVTIIATLVALVLGGALGFFIIISRNQIELTLSVFFKLNGTSSCVAGLLRSIMPNNRSILFLAIFSYP